MKLLFQYRVAGVFSIFGVRVAFVSGFSFGLPRTPASTGRWRGPPRNTAYRGCGGSGARDLQVLCSHSHAPWGNDRLTAPASSSAGVSRHCSLTGAGCQTRRWRRGKEAGDCEDDWWLQMARGSSVQQTPYSGSGNSTAAASADPQAMMQESSPSSTPDMEDIGDRSEDNGGAGGTLTQELEASTARVSSREKEQQQQNFARTLWQFSRPHTMIGTAIAIPTMGVFAAPPGMRLGSRFFLAMLWAIVPSLLINIYITGLNQIMDVEIDRINKPHLPIPARNLTRRAAKATVTLCLLVGAALGLAPCPLGSTALSLTVALSVVIGTSYSLPPLRLKRFPQVAALCILVVRGSIINGGFYTHAQAAAFGLASASGLTAVQTLTLPLRDAKCALALAYFTVFAVVIALMKDVPDVTGDRIFNIPSFSVVLGEATLFRFARRLLTALLWTTSVVLAMGSRAAAAASLPRIAVARGFVAGSALVSGQLVRMRADGVDPKHPAQVYAFYMFLWKIFYVSYLFLPLAR